jgi:hypothetical protein
MSDFAPLGDLAAFAEWTRSCPWGPDGTWPAHLGPGDTVIDGLIAGLASHPETVEKRFRRSVGAVPAVLGCTPWLTSLEVVEALQVMPCCIVIDKKARGESAALTLNDSAQGISQALLRLEEWGPRDEVGNPPVITPGRRMPGQRTLEPVRMVGYRDVMRKAPLLHAKLAVCCACWWRGGRRLPWR